MPAKQSDQPKQSELTNIANKEQTVCSYESFITSIQSDKNK